MSVHILSPAPVVVKKVRNKCPTCDKRTTKIISFYEWYGPSVVCLACGERWNEEGREPRPFCRGWREDSVRKARMYWKTWRNK